MARLTKEITTLKTAKKLNDEADECAICLEDFSSGIKEQLGCGHVFHRACLESANAMTCPMCRQWDGSVNRNWAKFDGGTCQWWESDPVAIQLQILGYVYQARSHQDGCDPSEEEEQAFIVQCLTHAMRQDPFGRAEPKITDANQDFHVLRENFILALKLHKLIRSLAVNVDKSDERACHVETAVEDRLNLDLPATMMAVSVAVSRIMAALLDDPAYAPFVDAWLLSAAMPPAAQGEILIKMIEPAPLPRFKHSLWNRDFLARDHVCVARAALNRRFNPAGSTSNAGFGRSPTMSGDPPPDVDTLGIKALKELIASAGFSTEGCLDKAELRARAREALEAKRRTTNAGGPHSARFPIGAAVECCLGGPSGGSQWAAGTVVGHHYREPSWEADRHAPYQVQISGTFGGEEGPLVFAPADTDECIRGTLRFGVGDVVQCLLEDRDVWVQGTVLKLYHREPEWTDPTHWAPYQVRLEPGRWGDDVTIYAPIDTDECVRAPAP